MSIELAQEKLREFSKTSTIFFKTSLYKEKLNIIEENKKWEKQQKKKNPENRLLEIEK